MMDILKTSKSNCKDCHKCITSCPVNAINFSEGQAYINIDRCILDGACYNSCPQNAKKIRNDIEKVKKAFLNNKQVIVSVAPSFYAYYDVPTGGRILAFLKKKGVSRIEQTSSAAHSVCLSHYSSLKSIKSNLISSSCPAVVYYVEKYYPDLLHLVAPVTSPMIAHHKLLKKSIGDEFHYVFLGPCIAKKEEIKDLDNSTCITFEELEEWIALENEDIFRLEPIFFDDPYSRNLSRFSLIGEMVKIANIQDDLDEDLVISVSGIKNIQALFNSIRDGRVNYKFIEALACEGGCIMGPARPKHVKAKASFELRRNLIKESAFFEETYGTSFLSPKDLARTYSNKYINDGNPSEKQMREVLMSTGKFNTEDELNCGACGYDSCRDKAMAVINGMAEKEMCIPYMRTKAERFSSILLEANPNAVIILNNQLNIIDVNPAFIKLAGIEKDQIKNCNISAVFEDVRPYKNVLKDNKVHETMTFFKSRKVKKIIFSIPDQNILITFLIDITDVEIHKEALEKVKNETLENAQIVIERQMKAAHDVAVLLGETTAETEILLGKLINIIKQG